MRTVNLRAGRTGVVCGFFLFQIAISSAFAQGVGTPPAADAATAPFGGCEPIGMTASGELVFPLECKHKIQLQPSPVASEEKAPAADDKPVTSADAKPAVSETAPETAAAADKPAVETKAAAVEDKPAPAAASETLASTDKLAAPAEQKPVEAKPAEPAVEKAGEKAQSPKAENAKAESQKPVKTASPRAAATAGNASAKPAAVRQARARQVVAMAKPAQPAAASAHVEEKAAAMQTAGLPACTHYRSYNPASKSYRGFDGRMYGCR